MDSKSQCHYAGEPSIKKKADTNDKANTTWGIFNVHLLEAYKRH